MILFNNSNCAFIFLDLDQMCSGFARASKCDPLKETYCEFRKCTTYDSLLYFLHNKGIYLIPCLVS